MSQQQPETSHPFPDGPRPTPIAGVCVDIDGFYWPGHGPGSGCLNCDYPARSASHDDDLASALDISQSVDQQVRHRVEVDQYQLAELVRCLPAVSTEPSDRLRRIEALARAIRDAWFTGPRERDRADEARFVMLLDELDELLDPHLAEVE